MQTEEKKITVVLLSRVFNFLHFAFCCTQQKQMGVVNKLLTPLSTHGEAASIAILKINRSAKRCPMGLNCILNKKKEKFRNENHSVTRQLVPGAGVWA